MEALALERPTPVILAGQEFFAAVDLMGMDQALPDWGVVDGAEPDHVVAEGELGVSDDGFGAIHTREAVSRAPRR